MTIQQGCQLLGVSRSGWYAARRRVRQPKTLCGTRVRLRSVFEATGQCYGSRRLRQALAGQGIEMGRHRVRSLMKELQLKPVWKPKFIHTTDSNHNLPVYENVLDRQFEQAEANRAWVSDITYIRTLSGWLYLAVVLDLYSRKIVGWAMAPNMPAELVWHRLADCHCPASPVAVPDRTFRPGQSTSHEYRDLLVRHGFQGSMSRKGNCWDNAVMERFFLNLKMERAWRRQYANHAEAIRDATDYIVNCYNNRRLHSSLGYLPPNGFEMKMEVQQPICVSDKS
ncbi:IS3 family transposase [Methylomonas koyamae]|uniref:IS3 family transposase n=1 Tax=Methylomonas koyamae TaxID=702114 RepID=UPI002872F378|nr:IS3 family transposase [Methylomonas koyamae]WNB77601.1 IS3 family transposase [Methylomonas koyamae]